jgi:hypothetical protein
MSHASRASVATKLNKTVKTARNKAVKDAVLDEQYTAKVLEFTVAHLKQHQSTVASMVHERRKTIFEEKGLNAVVKAGDWVQIESDYSPRVCSDGGDACVTAVHCGEDQCPLVPERKIVFEVDVHYLIYGRRERGVPVSRLTVIPMPYTSAQMPLRKRVRHKHIDIEHRDSPPQRQPLEWLQYGLASRRHEKRGWLKKTPHLLCTTVCHWVETWHTYGTDVSLEASVGTLPHSISGETTSIRRSMFRGTSYSAIIDHWRARQ